MTLENPMILTELLVATQGFSGLNPAQAFAVCSCFIAEGRCDPMPVTDAAIQRDVRKAQRCALQVAHSLHSQGLCCLPHGLCQNVATCDGRRFLMQHVNPRLVATVLLWAQGEPFS